jgi:hypothetical protein
VERVNMDITLADVESAIRVLTEFMKKQREAQRLLFQMGAREGKGKAMPTSMEGFIQYIFDGVKQKQAQEKGEPQQEQPQATEEDLKRMREIAEKHKA